MNRAEIMEDPDLDKEIDVLAMTGLKNQVQTLQFSRLMGKILNFFPQLIYIHVNHVCTNKEKQFLFTNKEKTFT